MTEHLPQVLAVSKLTDGRHMNIEQLRDFLCVAETLNMTLAADRRNTTQSNLSKRLRGLEEYLGRLLINRRSVRFR
ncbi:helix-turn-helix domain-containing protein [Paracoccus methylarcula]|uniref:LysR family transcriptional regulator n=1 Tax=Paracoccus methylarcula TaxID=72022 RepID=A0A3R7LJ97_9RHOB|nr:LysR family transcriptional regulator [Paracoccus methylarcula]RNF35859.1 LysR family transcriptional regulator [Paracoccus methylarcula]